MVAHEHWTPSKTCESPPSTQTWTTSKSFKTRVSHVWSPTPKPSKHACFTQLSRCFVTTGKEGRQPCASIWPRQTKPVYPGHHLDPGHWSGHWTQIIHWTLVTSPQSQDIGAIYQTLPMGSFFEEKVPFDLISIKNEGFRFLLDDNYLK